MQLGKVYLPVAGVLFFTLTLALFVSIMLVICCLKAKQRHGDFTQEFESEIKNLLIILLVFSSSFLLRTVFDLF